MLERFPLHAALRDGRKVQIRPFVSDDVNDLYAFFQRLPADVRRFAWDRVDDRAVIERWGANLDYDKVLPLLALDGSKIVADATLHRRDGGPLRLVGRVTWTIDPEWRGGGLGLVLINHFISIARDSGLRHLTCMLFPEQEEDAIGTLSELGFERYVVPGYGTDPDGNQYDMVKLVLGL